MTARSNISAIIVSTAANSVIAIRLMIRGASIFTVVSRIRRVFEISILAEVGLGAEEACSDCSEKIELPGVAITGCRIQSGAEFS